MSVQSIGQIRILVLCAAAVAGLTLAERYQTTLPVGLLFLVPLIAASAVVSRGIAMLLAVGVALEHEFFAPYAWDGMAWLRLPLTMLAYLLVAVFVVECFDGRRAINQLSQRIEKETQLRTDAERDIRAVIESTPAAILTVNSDARISMANLLARRMLGFIEGSPEGQEINNFIPILAKLLTDPQAGSRRRTVLDVFGRRQNGETFTAQIWVSLYVTKSGTRLAAILSDSSEDFIETEERGLRELLTSSRVISGAVSHEIRNLAAAAAILYNNMSAADVELRGSRAFETLGRVLDGISKLSSGDLQRDASKEALEGLSVAQVLRELELIITPTFNEANATLEWEIDDELPHVRASRSSFLQVCINLAQNSCRAVSQFPGGRLRITAFQLTNSVVIRFSDNGPGMRSLDRLFQPLQPGAQSRGLGLFISRAIVQSFGGDLNHTQRPGECAFIIELPVMDVPEDAHAQ